MLFEFSRKCTSTSSGDRSELLSPSTVRGESGERESGDKKHLVLNKSANFNILSCG